MTRVQHTVTLATFFFGTYCVLQVGCGENEAEHLTKNLGKVPVSRLDRSPAALEITLQASKQELSICLLRQALRTFGASSEFYFGPLGVPCRKRFCARFLRREAMFTCLFHTTVS